jgi:hypothetical protein
MSNMQSYTIRVRLGNGMITEVTVQAISPGVARQIVEGQYGSGSFLGYL